jgi:hypothetical protein
MVRRQRKGGRPPAIYIAQGDWVMSEAILAILPVVQ